MKSRIEQPSSPRRHLVAMRWLIVIVTLASFAPVCGHEFTAWDDRWTIETNPWLNPPSLHGVAAAWTHADKGLYIPVTYTLWSALSSVSQVHDPAAPPPGRMTPNPWVFHSANLLIHVIAALLVFSILLRLTAHAPAACAAALLFALHPVQVDSVAWAAGTKDVLYGLLSLAAIRAYIATVDAVDSHRWWRNYLLATLGFVTAMLSKPTAIVLPIIVIAIDSLILNRRFADVMKMASPWLLLALPIAIIAKHVQPGTGIETTPLWTRPFIASDAITFYMTKLIWPANLAIIYGRTPAWVMQHAWVYLTPIVPVALMLSIALYRPARRWLIAAAIIFIACLAPVLGFTPFLFQFHSTVADHYLYLAMFAVALAAAWALWQFWSPRLAIFCGVILVILAIRTCLQTLTWENSLTLYAHAIEVAPHSATAHNNYGSNLWDAGDHPAAAREFAEAIELRPRYIDAHENIVMALTERGEIDQAIEHLQTAVKLQSELPPGLRPKYESDVVALARVLANRGRATEAVGYLENLLREQKSDEAEKLLADLRSEPAPATTAPTTAP